MKSCNAKDFILVKILYEMIKVHLLSIFPVKLDFWKAFFFCPNTECESTCFVHYSWLAVWFLPLGLLVFQICVRTQKSNQNFIWKCKYLCVCPVCVGEVRALWSAPKNRLAKATKNWYEDEEEEEEEVWIEVKQATTGRNHVPSQFKVDCDSDASHCCCCCHWWILMEPKQLLSRTRRWTSICCVWSAALSAFYFWLKS